MPIRNGFVYLVAIIVWQPRKFLSWRLPNSLDAAPCVEALEETLATYGAPEIANSGQGCQLTSADFTDLPKDHGIKMMHKWRRALDG